MIYLTYINIILIILGLYLATFDWPNHNYGTWRNMGEKIENNKFSDGKWRFMTYDLDKTMGNFYGDIGVSEHYQYNMFNHMDYLKIEAPTNLFVALLKNEEFKNQFIKVFEEYANILMSTDKTDPLIQEFHGEVTELIGYTQSRWWGFFGGTRLENIAYAKNNYQTKILPQIKKFFEERSKYALDQMKQYLK